MYKFFITATDTDAGKTFVATALVKALVNTGKTVAVYKPISAGCEVIDGELINEDAFLLQQVANSNQSISNVNPIAYEEPIAPHIAAAKSNQSITVEDVLQHYTNVTSLNADITLTEGAGGWRLPLGNGKYLSEFVQQSDQKVILVVNMKLGCLNHAILTYETILADGLECIGWVANTFEGMSYLEENITELQSLIAAPMLARLDNEISTDIAANKFDLTLLT
jgi:dethiobiotin synthetase